MNTAEVILSNFEFCSKSDLLVTVMVPEPELKTTEVIMSHFEICSKGGLLVTVMVSEVMLNRA